VARNAKQRREQLFQQGVAAWQRATGDERGIYVCPLCGVGFTPVALELTPPLLSLEDVPSKAAGGRPLVLTCRQCNSTAGYGIDKAVAAREEGVRIADALLERKGTYTGPARVVLDRLQTNAKIKITPDATILSLPVEKNDPYLRERQIAELKQRSGAGNLELNLNFPQTGHEDRKARLGDLKAAYLAAFATFGYNWALHPRVNVVRRQLWSPKINLITHAWLPRHQEQPDGIFVMKSPVSCLSVSLRVFDVLLPWINGPEDVYSAISAVSRDPMFSATVVPFHWPKRTRMLMDFDPDVPPGSLQPPLSFER
jgi:hypothetical protein